MSATTSWACNNHDSVIIQTEAMCSDPAVDVSVGGKKIYVSSFSEDVAWKLWEQLHKSRELEITTQWQRSIFLSAFIILLLTGSSIFSYHFILNNELSKFAVKHCLIGIFLSIVLITSGVLWLAMSKGSKYWTNLYERKIDLIELELKINKSYSQFRYLEEIYRGEDNVKAADNEIYRKNKSLVPDLAWWRLNADTMSPSKVTIFIGWMVIFLGFFFFILNISIWGINEFVSPDFFDCILLNMSIKSWIVIISILIFLVFCVFLFFNDQHSLRSILKHTVKL